jgi:maleate isomerase
MARTVRLGMLTPSSNTVIEPVCAGVIAELPEVTCHFGRFRVTETSLGAAAQVQFGNEPKVTAAQLLADAKVDVICWNGTSGGWLGIDTDRKLCAEIFAATGIPATSSVLALQDLLRGWGVRRLGLVSPYLSQIQDLVIATFGNLGYECVAEQHLGIRDNDAFSTVARDVIAGMVRNVARQQPDAIVTFCTNLRAAPLVAQLERETGIPIFDSTAAGVWGALHRVGIDSSGITGWGRMFSDPH